MICIWKIRTKITAIRAGIQLRRICPQKFLSWCELPAPYEPKWIILTVNAKIIVCYIDKFIHLEGLIKCQIQNKQ